MKNMQKKLDSQTQFKNQVSAHDDLLYTIVA